MTKAITCMQAHRGSGPIILTATQPVLIPQKLVPTLHYYRPEIVTIGYEAADHESAQRVVASAPAARQLFCAEAVCARFEAFWTPGDSVTKVQVGRIPDTGERFYAATLNER